MTEEVKGSGLVAPAGVGRKETTVPKIRVNEVSEEGIIQKYEEWFFTP